MVSPTAEFDLGTAKGRIDIDTTGLKKVPADATKASSSMSKFAGVAKTALGTIGVAFGALQVVQFVKGTISAASDLNESMSKVGVVFDENAQKIIDWSKTSAEAMGISQQQALESAGTFGNLFTAMGLTSGASADMSTSLVQLASDLASFNNVDPAEVLVNLRAGLVGEAEPLRKFGINISAAATAQEAMNLGLSKTGKNLTAAQKAQANYSLIMKQSTTAQGDFARTSSGLANQQRILAAEFQNAQATIGKLLLPAMLKLVGALNALLNHLPEATAAVLAFGAAWAIVNREIIAIKLLDLGSQAGALASKFGPTIAVVYGFVRALQAAGSELDAIKNKDPAGIFNSIASGLDIIGIHVGKIDDAGQTVEDFTVANHELSQTEKDLIPTTFGVAEATKTLGEERAEATQAAIDQKNAEQALAGGLLGVVGSLNQLKQDQKDLNDLRKQGKKGTQEYKDQELKLLNSQLSLNDSINTYTDTLIKSDKPQSVAIQHVMEIGRQAGMTAAETRNVLGPAIDYIIEKYKKVPGKVHTAVTATDNASATLQAIIDKANELARLAHLNLTVGIHGGQQFAAGGVTGPGVAMVGEKGPELAIFPTGTTIVPNSMVRAMVAGSRNNQSATAIAAPRSLQLMIELDGKRVSQTVELHSRENKIRLGGRP